MRLHNRKGLLTLMVVRDVSQRELATAAGYRSHSYLGRLLRGEVDTLEPTAALRIARHLDVEVGFLFGPRAPSGAGHPVHRCGVAPRSSSRAPSATLRVPLAASGPMGSSDRERKS